ncbi:PREDICTED: protein ROOT PRIMORDIUM DEFECTIVE 1-like [Camelina sativa]|uniref:Protein ROOT PRIMORDIUM DEFECTIVE 1-like n=1 Tax=Camelina sativa TaxID=90675 RepID=A0ABM1QUF0_CAMSA|nr:PREDICTED: protein ROOT PRIMORDIUM DEFECTIVE 1-like [Camelina sativa]XP_019090388.1 PREDICTED: protein ROOT PRIMORDIUM DEFECTIVE 1-like [Camelina sativa]
MRWLLQGRVSLCKCKERFDFFQQRCGLVNVKLKWVKDKELDAVVIRERHLKAVCNLVSVISSSPDLRLPIFKLLPHRGQLGLPQDLKLSAFIRRYPNIFVEHCYWDSAGTRVPCFGLTREAMDLYCEEADVLRVSSSIGDDVLVRLCKLLMLTCERTLALHSIDHLRWDLGLPYDYRDSLIPKHPDLFCLVNLSSDLVGLKLIHWDDSLAVSKLQLREDVADNDHMAFPVKFTRGFGLKRKSIQWLQEWQRLPYTSPYVDASHLDPRTDLSEKRNVGVFHELLHLTIGRKTERQNVSNLRKPFALPQKFTKVFERHPGIFYISMKCDTQTVILREAYDRRHLIEKHPLVQIREKFANMMNEGFLDTSRGLGQNSSKTVSPVWSDEEEEEKEEKRRTII